MERLHPGVYIEEVPSGARPIEGVGTSTTAFIGWAPKGPLDKAELVTSFIEFEKKFGSFYVTSNGSILSYLAHAVFQFFNNGGRKAYVVRVTRESQTATITLKDRKASPADTLEISASSPGAWGNELILDVADGTRDPYNEFSITVKRQSFSDTAPVTLETHDHLSMDPRVTNYVERVIAANSQVITASRLKENASTSPGTSRSADSPQTDLTAPLDRNMQININEDGFQVITLAGTLNTGDNIAEAITKAVSEKLKKKHELTKDDAFTKFKCSYKPPSDSEKSFYLLKSGTSGIDADTGIPSSVEVADAEFGNVTEFLKLGRFHGGIEQYAFAELRPARGTFYVGVDPKLKTTLGVDGKAPQLEHYHDGLSRLNSLKDFSLLAIPGVGPDVITDGVTYCQNRAKVAGVNDCFFIGEMAVTDDTIDEAKDYITHLTSRSPYAAVYFPWLEMVDPTGKSATPIRVPPSGFVAGVFAAIDGKRGVWKAPAGTEANILGASGLAKNLTDDEQDFLNNRGVNCIRSFPASGIVIWGARTLSTASQPEWRYVPVRRMAIFLEVSIYNGIQWAVFEPNDEDLWANLRLNINSFMMRLFRQGAFQGKTPQEAFFVKCDKETTTQADIDAGTVNVLVGFAPLKPAEFVVIKISQKTSQAV